MTTQISKVQKETIRRNLFSKSFENKKVIQHNRDLHATSAYLAEQARGMERRMSRKGRA